MNSNDDGFYTQVDIDLERQRAKQAETLAEKATVELSKATRSVESLKNEIYRQRRSYRKAALKALAIVVPIVLGIVGFIIFGYLNFGGGPAAREAADVAETQRRAATSWETQCEKAGGMLVGDKKVVRASAIYCVFDNGAKINKVGYGA